MAADASLWEGAVAVRYRKLLMAGAVEKSRDAGVKDGKVVRKVVRRGISKDEAAKSGATDGSLPFATMLRCRIRYFTDGAVIGSRAFVDEAFARSRERFGAKRKDGARRLRGTASAASGSLWSIRDLQQRI